MANLVAKSPADGLLPVSFGDVTLSEAPMVPITWIAPLRGQEAAVSAALKKAVGVTLPKPNRVNGTGKVRAVWAGPGQALVLGAEVSVTGAAVADQSDGWTWLVLEGPGAPAVLARLTPIDLRPDQFKTGQAGRTLLFHMTATLIRSGADRYEVLVFRSMARTAVHDLSEAMRRVAARG